MTINTIYNLDNLKKEITSTKVMKRVKFKGKTIGSTYSSLNYELSYRGILTTTHYHTLICIGIYNNHTYYITIKVYNYENKNYILYTKSKFDNIDYVIDFLNEIEIYDNKY